jgi:putative protein kinase ArgK-like GTPase of G3E family
LLSGWLYLVIALFIIAMATLAISHTWNVKMKEKKSAKKHDIIPCWEDVSAEFDYFPRKQDEQRRQQQQQQLTIVREDNTPRCCSSKQQLKKLRQSMRERANNEESPFICKANISTNDANIRNMVEMSTFK